MIVAYHKGTIVYAYKATFNYNIDHDWTGGVLVNFEKIIDKCTGNKNVQPAPSGYNNNHKLLGLAFDKSSPYNYLANCDTILLLIVDGLTVPIPEDLMFSKL